MGFETKINSVVEDTVQSARAGFEYGTLFVSNITNEESLQILEAIREVVQCKVDLNRAGTEFAYDFI